MDTKTQNTNKQAFLSAMEEANMSQEALSIQTGSSLSNAPREKIIRARKSSSDPIRDALDKAILSGGNYSEFIITHPGIPFNRWENRYYRLRREGKLPKTPRNRNLSMEGIPNTLKEERLRLQLSEAKKENNELKQLLMKQEDLDYAIKDIARFLPELTTTFRVWKQDQRLVSQSNITALALLSDVHCGQQLFSERSGGLGSYDLDQFRERARNYTRQVISVLLPLVEKGDLTRLVIDLLGDFPDGRTIHPGQAIQSVPYALQMAFGPEVIAQEVIYPLANLVPQIVIIQEPGNHGRTGDKGELDKVLDSSDTVFYHILQIRTEGLKNVVWIPNETWFSYYKIYDHCVFSEHGDTVKSQGDTVAQALLKRKRKMMDMVGGPIDLFTMGHLHCPTSVPQGYGYAVENGSWPGNTEYSMELGSASMPLQKLLLVTPDNPKFADYDLRLASKEEVITIQPAILFEELDPLKEEERKFIFASP